MRSFCTLMLMNCCGCDVDHSSWVETIVMVTVLMGNSRRVSMVVYSDYSMVRLRLEGCKSSSSFIKGSVSN